MLHSTMNLASPHQTPRTPSRILRSINRLHTLDFRAPRNLLISKGLRTLAKTWGVAPPRPSSLPILDLPTRPRYCANETPVASLPHPAARQYQAHPRLGRATAPPCPPSLLRPEISAHNHLSPEFFAVLR